MKQKALCAGDAHSHEAVHWRKWSRSTSMLLKRAPLALSNALGAIEYAEAAFSLIFLREITGKGNEVP